MAEHVPSAGTEDPPLKWVTVPAFLYVIAHLLAFLIPERFWGVDSLVYLSPYLAVLLIVSPIAVLVGPIRNKLIDLASPLHVPAPVPALIVILCLLFLSLSWLLLTETHLLGDGLRYIRYLRDQVWDSNPRADRAPLTFWLVRQIHSGPNQPDAARMAYGYVSLMSGVAYVILAVLAGRTFGRSGCVWPITALLLVQGYVVMFFGYVETYPILFPSLLGVLILARRTMEGRMPLWVPCVALGVATTLHVTTVAVLPALAWAGFRRSSAGANRLVSLPVLFAVPATTALTLMAIGLPPDWFLHSTPGSFRLPWFDGGDLHIPYAVFSWAHFVELVNQYALAAPAFLICLAIGTRSGRSDVDYMLWFAAIPLVGFTVVFHPEIGAFRDWDAFALPALPLTLLAGRWLTGSESVRTHGSAVVIAACAAHTIGWAHLNTNTSASETRYAHLVENSYLSHPARAHGFGTLASHFRDSGRLSPARVAFADAIRHYGDNPRYHVGLAHILYLQGDHQAAEASLKRALEAGPDRLDTLMNLGVLFLDMRRYEVAYRTFRDVLSRNGDSTPAIHGLGMVRYREGRYAEAIAHFGKAVEADPANVRYLNDLGTAYLANGDLAQAEATLRQVIDLDAGRSEARINLGNVYYERGDYDAAAAAFRSALSWVPDRANLHLNLGLTYRELRDVERSRQHLARFLELAPNDPETVRIRELLEGSN